MHLNLIFRLFFAFGGISVKNKRKVFKNNLPDFEIRRCGQNFFRNFRCRFLQNSKLSKKSVGIWIKGCSPILICSLNHFKNPPEYAKISTLLAHKNKNFPKKGKNKEDDTMRCAWSNCRAIVSGDLSTYSQKQTGVILFDYCCNDHLMQHLKQISDHQWYNAMNSVEIKKLG